MLNLIRNLALDSTENQLFMCDMLFGLEMQVKSGHYLHLHLPNYEPSPSAGLIGSGCVRALWM